MQHEHRGAVSTRTSGHALLHVTLTSEVDTLTSSLHRRKAVRDARYLSSGAAQDTSNDEHSDERREKRERKRETQRETHRERERER